MVKTKQDLVNLLAQKNGLSRKKNVQFVNELVDLINEVLKDEKLLKISGLGTFKVIDTKDRESVNVQTGDRFVIEGRNKITFTPDAAMRELVNRPFSQFETVVLNDGVDFSDIPEEPADEEPIIEEPAPEEPIVEEPVAEEVAVYGLTEPIKEEPAPEEPVAEQPAISEPIKPIEPIVEEQPVEPIIEEPIVEEQPIEPIKPIKPIIEEPIVEEPINTLLDPENTETEENNNNETTEDTIMEEEKSNVWKWLAALIICTAIGFAGGYYVGKRFAPMKFIPLEKTEMIQGEFVDSTMIDSIYAEDSMEKARDAKIKARVDSITRAHEARNESIRVAKLKKASESTAKLDAAMAAKQAAQQSADNAPAVALPKGDNSQTLNNAKAMVSNGAYTIVGTQETITVKPGQNLKKISKFYLGDGMECYIQAYNGITEVTEGMKLKIPKLQVKKRK
ncbi:MAG: HU family DNA-binding protein [Prevotella sp.]|nr:HU family DNA-binding protein [Prevotella sp.]